MRLILLALLPAALAACGDDNVDPGARMPAPDSSVEAEAEAGTEAETPAAPEITAETIEGSWVVSTDQGDPSVLYGPEDSEAAFAVICRSSAIEGEPDMLVFHRSISGDMAGETIDFFTSAGNGSVDAVELETEMPMIGGTLDPSATLVSTLINASGDIRIRSGTNEIAIPASDELDTLLQDCRPEPEDVPEPDDGEEPVEGDDADSATDDETDVPAEDPVE